MPRLPSELMCHFLAELFSQVTCRTGDLNPIKLCLNGKQSKQPFTPKMIVWENHHPEDQLVPLRQPKQAVYFAKE